MKTPMSKTLFIALGICTVSITLPTAALSAGDKPNVIVIFADDLGYGDVGCFDRACPFETPNLDRMAADATRAQRLD